jgi:hypothetical protein
MNANGNKTIKVGMEIYYRPSWGMDAPKISKVISIELCENENEKYGVSVEEVPVENVNLCVFDLSDGHWCYGWQVFAIPASK